MARESIRKHRRLLFTAFAFGCVFLVWVIVDRLRWYGTESRYQAAVASPTVSTRDGVRAFPAIRLIPFPTTRTPPSLSTRPQRNCHVVGLHSGENGRLSSLIRASPSPPSYSRNFVHGATRLVRPSLRLCPCPSVPGAGLLTGILMCLAGYRRPGRGSRRSPGCFTSMA